VTTLSVFDLLDAGVQPKTRTLVIVGEDDDAARRGDKTVIAFSDCEYFCPDGETLVKCVEHIKASDERLRSRPEEQMLWDWRSTWMTLTDPDDLSKGGTIFLGVSWYDREFFDDRRDAWFGAMHQRIYKAIGVPLEQVSVKHFLDLNYAQWKPLPQAEPVHTAPAGSAS
jgi:hypothetical protein